MNHPELHATGHPAQEELIKLYQWLKPKHLMPVHGEARHQQAHQTIAEQLGFSAPLTPVNGDLLRFDNYGLHCEAHHVQPPCIVNQNRVVPHPGLDAAISTARRGSLYLALPVTISDHGWARIGRLMLDATNASPLDEGIAFIDWLDEQLDQIAAGTLGRICDRRCSHA